MQGEIRRRKYPRIYAAMQRAQGVQLEGCSPLAFAELCEPAMAASLSLVDDNAVTLPLNHDVNHPRGIDMATTSIPNTSASAAATPSPSVSVEPSHAPEASGFSIDGLPEGASIGIVVAVIVVLLLVAAATHVVARNSMREAKQRIRQRVAEYPDLQLDDETRRFLLQ